MKELILKYESFEAYMVLWNAASDIIIFQHFTIGETEAYKKHGVTFSQVAAGGIWPQAPWLPERKALNHYTTEEKKKKG